MSVERTVKVATIVATIEEAFAFVITHIDGEGMTAPRITIQPVWTYSDDHPDGLQRFEVGASGNVAIRAVKP